MLFSCSMIEIKETDITEPRCHSSSPQSDVLTDELMDDWGYHDPEFTDRAATCLCVLSYLVCRFHLASIGGWVCESVQNDKGATVCAFIRVLFTDKNNRMLQFALNCSFVMWLCFICIEDITPADQTNGVYVCVFCVCARVCACVCAPSF